MKPFCTIPVAIIELKKGKMLIVVDNPDRENQGDVIFPAQTVTSQKVNFLMQHCHGNICTPLTASMAADLDIPLMVPSHIITETTKLQFTVSIDAKTVSSFGVSAKDKEKTIRLLVGKNTKSSDFVRPGHVFPIIEANGGLYARQGHTEATLALCRLADFLPVGVLSEIIDGTGNPAKEKNLYNFAQKHNLCIVTISDLIQFTKKHTIKYQKESWVMQVAHTQLPTQYGTFTITVFSSVLDSREHVVLTMGDISPKGILTRIHSQCFTGDTLHSLRCDCGQQFEKSLELIGKRKQGILLYLSQEGRGIGLLNKIRAYKLQEKGLDTVEANRELGFEADSRDYQIAAEILTQLGVSSISLLTNNPRKIELLKKNGIKIVKRLSIVIPPNPFNMSYLETKRKKLGHLL